MKKLIIAMVIGLLLVAALVTSVLADNGPHGGFTNTTEKCAGCHRAHSAKGATYLLVNTSVEALCFTCHDGTGAYTNVVDGVYQNATIATLSAPLGTQGDKGIPLFGGGFDYTSFPHTWNGKDGYDASASLPSPATVTSSHSINGSSQAVFGAGDYQVATVPTYGSITLECTSCHDPHGRAGRGPTTSTSTFTASASGGILAGLPMPSYRLLRFEPTGSNGFEVTGSTTLAWWAAGNSQSTDGITVRETANYWYTPNTSSTLDGTVMFYRTRYDSVAGEWTAWGSYIAQIGDLAGRSYVYARPAASVTATVNAFSATTNGVKTSTCKDGSGNLPPLPTATTGGWLYTIYACGSTTGTSFNNNGTTLAGGLTAGRAQLGYWCGTCHDRYMAGSGSRDFNSGDGYYTYRHNSASSAVCVDCHVAHGTSSVMTNTNTIYPTASLTTGSILMKLDERSICLKCHGHSVNFNYLP